MPSASSSSHPGTSLRQSSPSTTTPLPTSGSQTITQPANPTLRLRGQHTSSASNPSTNQSPSTSSSNRRHIQWDASVIDNEGMGKKSSKVCCIYHAPHEPGDSESDSSSESDSDSEGERDLSRAQRAGGRGKKGGERKASPNAYERQPKGKGKGRVEKG